MGEDIVSSLMKIKANKKALKGVISKVLDEDEAPISDYRPEEPIEAILTPTGIISRMTSDIYSLLFSNLILVESRKTNS